MGLLSIIGCVAIGSWVAEPALRGGRSVIGNLGNAVGSAIERANEERHNEIRKAHTRRKLASSQAKSYVDASDDIYSEARRSRSSLLLRMAALRKSDEASSILNTDAVERYFPTWVGDDGSGLKSEAVLKDLVVAVALLAHESFDRDKNT